MKHHVKIITFSHIINDKLADDRNPISHSRKFYFYYYLNRHSYLCGYLVSETRKTEWVRKIIDGSGSLGTLAQPAVVSQRSKILNELRRMSTKINVRCKSRKDFSGRPATACFTISPATEGGFEVIQPSTYCALSVYYSNLW